MNRISTKVRGMCWLCALATGMAAHGQLLDSGAQSFSFQARLSGPGVTVVGPGTVDLEINIYASDVSPTPVDGPIALNGVPTNNGIVSTTITGVDPAAFDGASRWLGVRVNGGSELPRIRLSSVPYAYRVNRVASTELDDNIALGGPSAPGSLSLYGAGGVASEGAFALKNTIGGTTLAHLGKSQNHGQLYINDSAGEAMAALGNGFLAGTGGRLDLYMAGAGAFNDTPGVSIIADDGDAGVLRLTRIACDPFCFWQTTATLDANDDNGGGALTLGNGSGVDTIRLATNVFGSEAALLSTYSSGGTIACQIGTGALGDGGAEIFQDDGTRGVALTGDGGSVGGGGRIRVWDENVQETIDIRGNFNGAGTGAWMAMREGGQERITLAARAASTGRGGLIEVKNNSGVTTVQIFGDTGAGAGRVKTPVLEITGGSDLAESFDISGDGIEPGAVVVIDPANPGRLTASTTPYDRKVAGVISGAGGVKPGMVMGQRDSIADGSHHVALTGRVYCWCDASYGAIRPGDRLTTSATAGHAMRVADGHDAAGAVIGKAMTSLESGRGLVLMLVQPQ